ncbi:hypothetical protein PRIPAC_96046 [Pristionchus pacificus]|uniref:Uncharacterized protein n=1 Tax=Pristionchus pacificus TaxID=54126 RepID=A0A2A6BIY7_PRIPA|nr:hypothetical protein PRIPAC_96046 [Pristionchus pacificus]|eukprot:PDM65761.1 hypothetical protein PRIPAC_45162 [Pristionchus pacificus]
MFAFSPVQTNAAGCFGPLGRRHPTASRRVDLVSTTPLASGVQERYGEKKMKTNAAGCFGPLGRRHPTASRRVDLVSTTPLARETREAINILGEERSEGQQIIDLPPAGRREDKEGRTDASNIPPPLCARGRNVGIEEAHKKRDEETIGMPGVPGVTFMHASAHEARRAATITARIEVGSMAENVRAIASSWLGYL